MNPFTQHTKQQGVTYRVHLLFAMGISIRLLASVIAFAIHAVFPFISIESRNDLEATAAFLEEQNQWIETVEKPAKPSGRPSLTASRNLVLHSRVYMPVLSRELNQLSR